MKSNDKNRYSLAHTVRVIQFFLFRLFSRTHTHTLLLSPFGVVAECACASLCHIPFHAVNMNGWMDGRMDVRCFAVTLQHARAHVCVQIRVYVLVLFAYTFMHTCMCPCVFVGLCRVRACVHLCVCFVNS